MIDLLHLTSLTEEEKLQLEKTLEDYVAMPRVQQMKKYTQHGKISTFQHCYRVAIAAMWINRRWNVGADENILLPAALLHDMFLYDWHTIGQLNPHHAVNHAALASRNASRYCGAGELICYAISCHMWPVNITRVPRTREAVILCIADKYCSLIETVLQRKSARSGQEMSGRRR